MSGQSNRGFESSHLELVGGLRMLQRLVPETAAPATASVHLEDVVGGVELTVEDDVARAAVTIAVTGEDADPGVGLVTLPRTQLRSAVAGSSATREPDEAARVRIAPVRSSQWEVVANGSRQLLDVEGGSRLAPGPVVKLVAQVSRPAFLDAIRCVRFAAQAADVAAPAVTLALTRLGLTFGAGDERRSTLATAVGSVAEDAPRDAVAVLPEGRLSAFAAVLPNAPVRIWWPVGDEQMVAFGCGPLWLSLRTLAPETPRVVPSALDDHGTLGRVTVGRAWLAGALNAEAAELRRLEQAPSTIVLRPRRDGRLEVVSPERDVTRASRPWVRRAEVSGRGTFYEIDLHCDFGALSDVLRRRQGDFVGHIAEDLVALDVSPDGQVVVTAAGVAPDDLASPRDVLAGQLVERRGPV